MPIKGNTKRRYQIVTGETISPSRPYVSGEVRSASRVRQQGQAIVPPPNGIHYHKTDFRDIAYITVGTPPLLRYLRQESLLYRLSYPLEHPPPFQLHRLPQL